MSGFDRPARLKAQIWVQATLRQCQAAGAMALVARHGDDDAGIVLIKHHRLGAGFRVYTPVRDAEGELGWLEATGKELVAEDIADAYIRRQIERDSDLWVIEIEERTGVLPFPHRIVG